MSHSTSTFEKLWPFFHMAAVNLFIQDTKKKNLHSPIKNACFLHSEYSPKYKKLRVFFSPIQCVFCQIPKLCETEELLVRRKIQLQNRENRALNIYGHLNGKESQELSAILGDSWSGQKVEVPSGAHLCSVTLYDMM